MSGRTSIIIETTFLIMKGRLQLGMNFFGPFATQEEAVEYCGKNFPDETACIMPMNKEIHTHGEKTNT